LYYQPVIDPLSRSESGPSRLVERAVLRDGACDQLIEMLLGGALERGTNLSIEGPAYQLGGSPAPVREALVHLEHTGLVSPVALRGYRVAPPPSEHEAVAEHGRVPDAIIAAVGAKAHQGPR
jgi:DNA-binding GntR family transcriptional regulator